MQGSFPNEFIDHINRDRSDNRWTNLRSASREQNNRNACLRKDSSSSYKGVSRTNKQGVTIKWGASIRQEGKSLFLGVFGTKEEAARAYDSKAYDLFGEYAYLNFPEETILRKNIEERKVLLADSVILKFKTDCKLTLRDVTKDLRELNYENLTIAMLDLHILSSSAKSLDIDFSSISNFPIKDWIYDLQILRFSLARKDEESRLKVLENKLHDLLSLDKKVELTLDELGSQI